MNKIAYALLVLLLAILVTPILADTNESEDFLPIGLTEEEKTRLDEIGLGFQKTPPPAGVMRACAEWEYSTKVIIRWPLGISTSLIAEMSEDVIVTTIVGSASQQSSAMSSYTSAGVNMLNTEFIIAPTNSIWTRDYGPWFIFDGNGDIGMVDHIYNRPRPQDDVIPAVLSGIWGIPNYAMGLEHAGGNHMSDGLGLSMSTELVYDENSSMNQATIDGIMMDYLGNDYDVLEYIESGGIHHIDCWAKFLNPTTILVKDVPTGSSSYGLLNDRADYLAQQISPWGKPYTVVRIYCPYGTAYTNSLILNKKVLVPIFSNSWDAAALQTYEDAMPGYEIIGFTGSWLDDDAIHCRAMGVPDPEMIHIKHVPLSNTPDTLNDYLVTAEIFAHSDGNLLTDSMKIFYDNGKGTFFTAPMFATSEADSFYGYIPAQSGGITVKYYLRAVDDNDKIATHPVIGEAWAHQFHVTQAAAIVSADSFSCMAETEFAYYPQFVGIDSATATITYSDYPAWLTVSNDSLVGTPPDRALESFHVLVEDLLTGAEQDITLFVWVCGDSDASGAVDISDAVHLIAYIFNGGPAPDPTEAGDPDCSGGIDISDAVYLIAFIFGGGPAPCADCM